MFKKQKKAIKLVKNPSKIIQEEKKRWINWNYVFSAIGIVFSIITITYTSKQFKSNREHQKLSVRPVLSMVSHYDVEGKKVGLFIENYGDGAAIIQQINVYVDDKKFEHFEELGWLPIIKEFNIRPTFLKLGKISKNNRVKKNAEDWFLWRTSTDSKCALMTTHSFFNNHKIEFEIFYTDAYQEKLVEKLPVSYPKDFEDITKYGLQTEITTFKKNSNKSLLDIQKFKDEWSKKNLEQYPPNVVSVMNENILILEKAVDTLSALNKKLDVDKLIEEKKKTDKENLERICHNEFLELINQKKISP